MGAGLRLFRIVVVPVVGMEAVIFSRQRSKRAAEEYGLEEFSRTGREAERVFAEEWPPVEKGKASQLKGAAVR
jgi:hypothetical protein